MNKNKRLFFLLMSLAFPVVTHADVAPDSADEAADLIKNLKAECPKSASSCLSLIDQEDIRRASSATSIKAGFFGATANDLTYEDDAHYYRYKSVTASSGSIFKIGVGFHIAANMKDASMSLAASMNGIGIEGKPSKGATQLRIDLLGIDYADSSHDLYAAIPISIELDSDSIKRLGNSFSEKVKAALSDGNNVKLYVCPQVIDMRAGAEPGKKDDAEKKANLDALTDQALKLQTELNAICPDRFPNATMRYTNDVRSSTATGSAVGVATASATDDKSTVFQEYRRYRYDAKSNANGTNYGSVAMFGAKMYLSGLSNTGSLTSIASALFSLNGSRNTSAVQYQGYGLKTPGVMLADISGTQIGQPTYIVNVYHGFQSAKDEIDRNANTAPKVLASANSSAAEKKAVIEKAVLDISAAAQQVKDAANSGDDKKAEVAASEAATKATAASAVLNTAIKASGGNSATNQATPASVPLSNINSISN